MGTGQAGSWGCLWEQHLPDPHFQLFFFFTLRLQLKSALVHVE